MCTVLMKPYKLFILLFGVSILFSCGEKVITPLEAAQKTCECLKLGQNNNSEEANQAYKECNEKLTDMISEHNSDPKWMGEWREELINIYSDCMGQ